MSGGSVVIRPHPRSTRDPGESAIIGHCALYGSTGGALFVHGQAGDRFGVRNSGAVAVVEGTGLHACEYMTRGTIAILGPVSYNVGAGMTGGSVYLRRDQASMINTGYIVPRDMEEGDREELRELIARYWERTQSARAKSILEGKTDVNELYFKCVPRPHD
jgi:glutamate synthase domain-containing protein 3